MASNGSFATTLSPTRETLSNSQLLSSSLSSLSSSTSRQISSQISKIYRQASTLFLTRRLPESLSTILPVITPQASDDTNGPPDAAPISKAGKTTRIKVWSLYLTILNAVVELDPAEAKQAFGSSEWRALVTKVREGEVWEEVVQNGYSGVEGDVDSDVIINLATLLLAHARTQKTNQTRLETYLASSSTPSLDVSSRLKTSHHAHPRSRGVSPSKHSGTDTPRDLNARVKILELYTLHVLLRNNEWEYSREFISISPVLDEERREAFLQALQSLQDEKQESEKHEREERRYQEELVKKEVEDARRKRAEDEEKERVARETGEGERDRDKAGSEIDYGLDESPTPRPGSSRSRSSVKAHSAKGSVSHPPSKNTKSLPSSSPTARASIPAKKAEKTVIHRAGGIITNIKKLLQSMTLSFKTQPMFLLQMLAFIVGLLVVLSRREVKERVQMILGRGWRKVRATAGMGVKVTYI